MLKSSEDHCEVYELFLHHTCLNPSPSLFWTGMVLQTEALIFLLKAGAGLWSGVQHRIKVRFSVCEIYLAGYFSTAEKEIRLSLSTMAIASIAWKLTKAVWYVHMIFCYWSEGQEFKPQHSKAATVSLLSKVLNCLCFRSCFMADPVLWFQLSNKLIKEEMKKRISLHFLLYRPTLNLNVTSYKQLQNDWHP